MLKKIIDNYDSWAYKYDNNINPTRDLDKIATIKSLSNLKFFNVLELGCGSGKNTEWLSTNYYYRLIFPNIATINTYHTFLEII